MGVLAVRRTVGLIRLRRQVRDAERRFQRLTGLVAVTSLQNTSVTGQDEKLPLPVVHPRCADLLRNATPGWQCSHEWRRHIGRAGRTREPWIHDCRLGLRCAGVPIYVGDDLVGLSKLVCGPELPRSRFRSLVMTLEALLDRPCRLLYTSLLREENHSLQQTVELLSNSRLLPATRDNTGANGDKKLVRQILEYLNGHYTERDLSLKQVAGAVSRNDKYVAHLFKEQTGERMHEYINSLRVRHSCELLLQTDQPISQVAAASGFARPAQFRRSFHRAVGVTASEYRQIFTRQA